jgi:hypothetical protein
MSDALLYFRLDEYIEFGCKIHIAVVEGKNYLQIFGSKFNIRKKLTVNRSDSVYFTFKHTTRQGM